MRETASAVYWHTL